MGSDGWLVPKVDAGAYGIRLLVCHIPGWEASLVSETGAEMLSSEDM